MHWVWAILMVLTPLAVGGVLGSAAARLRSAGVRRGMLAALWLAPAGLAWVVAPAVPMVSAWDLLLTGAILSLGALLGAAVAHTHAGRREIQLLAIGSVLALLLAEVGARLILAEAPMYPAPSTARLVFPEQAMGQDGPPSEVARGRPWRCEGLYPEHYPEYLQVRSRPTSDDERTFLHVGDSMVEALGIRHPFPALLDRPGQRHINAGVSTTGPDYHYLLIKRWTEELDVDVVVHHVYSGNDLEDLDYPYFCCGGDKLLDLSRTPPRWRCPEPRTALDTPALLGVHSPPYPLRVATGISVLARHLVRAAEQAGRAVAVRHDPGVATGPRYNAAMRRMEQVIRATAALLKERNITYVLVVLPSLRDLGGEPQDRAHGEKLLADLVGIGKAHGITTLDATATLTTHLRQWGPESMYILGPDRRDHHFNEDGHRLYADWLGSALRSAERRGL